MRRATQRQPPVFQLVLCRAARRRHLMHEHAPMSRAICALTEPLWCTFSDSALFFRPIPTCALLTWVNFAFPAAAARAMLSSHKRQPLPCFSTPEHYNQIQFCLKRDRTRRFSLGVCIVCKLCETSGMRASRRCAMSWPRCEVRCAGAWSLSS